MAATAPPAAPGGAVTLANLPAQAPPVPRSRLPAATPVPPAAPATQTAATAAPAARSRSRAAAAPSPSRTSHRWAAHERRATARATDGNPGAGGAVALDLRPDSSGHARRKRLDDHRWQCQRDRRTGQRHPRAERRSRERRPRLGAARRARRPATCTLSGITNADITSGTGTFNASGFAGNVAIQYTAGAGQITGNAANTTLTGLAGGSTFVVNTGNGGTIDGTTTFGGVGSLAGGAGVDAFTVSGTGSLAGSIAGGGGANTLAVTTATANFVLATATSGTVSNVGGGYSGIASLTGNGTTSTLTGPSTGSTFNVTTPGVGDVNATTTFTGMAALAGGTGADSFVFTGTGALVGGVDGGTGAANTLDLSALATANFTPHQLGHHRHGEPARRRRIQQRRLARRQRHILHPHRPQRRLDLDGHGHQRRQRERRQRDDELHGRHRPHRRQRRRCLRARRRPRGRIGRRRAAATR